MFAKTQEGIFPEVLGKIPCSVIFFGDALAEVAPPAHIIGPCIPGFLAVLPKPTSPVDTIKRPRGQNGTVWLPRSLQVWLHLGGYFTESRKPLRLGPYHPCLEQVLA